ncbi:protein trapped in endoderm-1-like [Penaeus japonicus]|uniref:protein trapped in endoderm-1-like n=1 Tax=Penaeus japonicus TaxID=27405 RepID=UPI001C711AAB|nr:protein trapped in endoderm-1-like [Penaeus japonicus]
MATDRLCARRMPALKPLVRLVTDSCPVITLIILISVTTPAISAARVSQTPDVTNPGIRVTRASAATETATETASTTESLLFNVTKTSESPLVSTTPAAATKPTFPSAKVSSSATSTSLPGEALTTEEDGIIDDNGTFAETPEAFSRSTHGDGGRTKPNLSIYSPRLLGFTAACVILTGIVGTFGNLLAAISLLNSRQLRQSPSTAFMVNLPACLLPVCAVGLPLFAVGCIQIQWYGRVLMPQWVCILGFALGLTFSQVHLHTLCAIAFNRLVAVVWPAKYKRLMQVKVVKVYLALLWFYSALLWLPLTFGGPSRLVYVPKELMVSMKDESPHKITKAVHVFITYLLPIMITSVCYVVMYFKVRQSRRRRPGVRSKAADEASCSDGTNVMRQWDDHVTRTILVIFVLLLVCSVPHLVIHVLHLHTKYPEAWLLLHVVFWLQFCLDPIIYVLMSQHYRLACLEYLQKLFPGMNTFRVSVGNDDPRAENSNPFLQGTKYMARHSQAPDFAEETTNPMLIPNGSA